MPNSLNAAIAAAGLVAQAHRGGLDGLTAAALGMATALGLVIVPFALRLYRGGDAKLLIAIGAWLGPVTTAWAFVWGVAIGGGLAIAMALAAGPEARARVRQNLEMAARTVTVPAVEDDRPARLHVPMAVAFAVGALVAMSWR